ncbi:MAG: NUDIX domain-containing protein [Candidatus Scalindua sp.]
MMNTKLSKINIACGAVCETDGKILMVKEKRKDEGIVLNQPVGALELNEDICEATRREVKEETGLDIKLTNFLGIYVWLLKNGNTSLRFCFIGCVIGGELGAEIRTDEETVEPIWLSREELKQSEQLFRNPVTKKCLEDYFSGVRYPLDAVRILRDL